MWNTTLASFLREAEEQGQDDCNDVADALEGLRTDSMGRDTIWY